jgi:phospholipid/cholesterol/gamma-HCH transport system substrate-binding protein
MVKITKEVKVGATVLMALIILGWGVNFLKNKDVFMKGYKLYGVYSRIDGLKEASPIFYKGFEIGSVRQISLENGQHGHLIVTMSIDQDVEFPTNTIAQIYSLDLMGSKGIRFLYGDAESLLMPDDTMKTSLMGGLADQVSQEVLPLKDKAENLVVKFDSVLTNLNSFFNTENKKYLQSSVKNATSMMWELKNASNLLNASLQQDGAIGMSLQNMLAFTNVLNEHGKSLAVTMDNIEALSGQMVNAHVDSLVYEMNQSVTALNTALESVNNKEGTLGLLLKDKQLYYNLNEVSVSLDRLLNDVRHQPKRYVNFSAVSFGGGKTKKVKDQDEVVYKVLLDKTKEPNDLRGRELLEGEFVQEDRDGRYYLYTLGEEKEYEQILVLKDSIVDLFPHAQVVAMKGGELVSVDSTR